MSAQSSMADVLVAASRAEHAALGAELIARAIVEAVDARGVARVALSGGTTPSETYQKLAAMTLPFDRVEWYWVDERGVPPDNPRSNYGAAARDLGLGGRDGEPGRGSPNPSGGKHGRAYRMEGERDLREAAEAYEKQLRKAFGVAAAVSFDAMTMGVGDDGHTASLFPGIGAVGIDDRLVAHIREQPDKKLEARVTLTAPVIQEARLVVVIVRGESKRKVVAAARGPGSDEEVPSRLLQRAKGRVVWVLDREAAGQE